MKVHIKEVAKIIDNIPNWSANCPFKIELKKRLDLSSNSNKENEEAKE